jgi:hypothetical protein
MSDRLIIGPYRMIKVESSDPVPWYIIPFDKKGICTGPLTRDHLLTHLQDETYTDILLFSHGWNNDWKAATERYEHFLKGFMDLRRTHHLNYSRPVRPLLVGIFWPSTALVMPWEVGPTIAAEPQQTDEAVSQERQEIQTLAEMVAPEDVPLFYRLAQLERLNRDEALQLARILTPVYADPDIDDDLLIVGPSASPKELVSLWQRNSRLPEDTSGDFGFADEVTESEKSSVAGINQPELAGDWLGNISPRDVIRAATVLQMKDRAGVVGAHGVSSLLQDLLAQSNEARLHLIGHSYGCKVVLSALCYKPLPRPVNSVLLLQPAISYLCFATDATGAGQPGGYRGALAKVEQPILSTFSPHDVELTQLFHWAVRRRSDTGDLQIAGGGPPNQYAALGGYGPGGCAADCQEIELKDVGDRYELGTGAPEIYALNGREAIKNHGDISNRFTWWALYNQLAV